MIEIRQSLRLCLCIAGIYSCFLLWGMLQERITTIDYQESRISRHSSVRTLFSVTKWIHSIFVYFGSRLLDQQSPSRFSSFVFLNLAQSIISSIISLLVLHISKPPKPTKFTWNIGLSYLKVAACFCCASPFGYSSLQYLDYVTMSLGKSCKLVPLVLISLLVRRQKISRIKLISLMLITLGVSGFMLLDGSHTKGKPKQNFSPSLDRFPIQAGLGIVLLLINMVLDGAMNTFQGEMFSTYKINSFEMMFHQNWMSAVLMLCFLASPYGWNELMDGMTFIVHHADFLDDMLLFAVCGSMGQVFVFYTIEHFGPLLLVTITVTRKLFTILFSVFYFNHQLNTFQWICVAVVFVGLFLEAFLSKHKKQVIPQKPVNKKAQSIEFGPAISVGKED